MEVFLKNYYRDLEYQFKQNGIESVNYNSCGTPEFQTEAEYVAYMKDLKSTIDLLAEKEAA
tara:strand:- start:1 stop:183 length:183 start_codon:yes stop_codon:yes gene_type:complete